MYSAISKSLAAIVLSAMVILSSCGNKDAKEASALLSQSQEAIDAHNYAGALTLLDTLNSRYPKQLDIRRSGLRLRALAMEGMAMDSIAVADSILAWATLNREEFQRNFKHIDSSVGLEGYFLPEGTSDKMMTETAIQARVSDKGYFYIVANVQGRAIGLKSITLSDGSEQISSSEISPPRVVKVEGSESASFNPEELEGIGVWLIRHPSCSKITFNGIKGDVSIKMSKSLYNEITACDGFSEAMQAQRRASIRREKFERMLATARDQLANMPVAEEEK